jgi:hypothetical protein
MRKTRLWSDPYKLLGHIRGPKCAAKEGFAEKFWQRTFRSKTFTTFSRAISKTVLSFFLFFRRIAIHVRVPRSTALTLVYRPGAGGFYQKCVGVYLSIRSKIRVIFTYFLRIFAYFLLGVVFSCTMVQTHDRVTYNTHLQYCIASYFN